jgi:hypothetical protein
MKVPPEQHGSIALAVVCMLSPPSGVAIGGLLARIDMSLNVTRGDAIDEIEQQCVRTADILIQDPVTFGFDPVDLFIRGLQQVIN